MKIEFDSEHSLMFTVRHDTINKSDKNEIIALLQTNIDAQIPRLFQSGSTVIVKDYAGPHTYSWIYVPPSLDPREKVYREKLLDYIIGNPDKVLKDFQDPIPENTLGVT